MKSIKLREDIHWVGSLDPKLRVFDIIMETEFGTTYNSYVVKGSKKTAVVETVKEKCFDEYIEKLSELIKVEDIDYIVVNHTEPDHAGSIKKLLNIAHKAVVVGSETAIEFLENQCNMEFRHQKVDTGDTLDLGNKTFKFISAPFLHWPDSIYTYLPEEKMLFTCDSFGSHYSFDGVLYSKIENKDDYKKALAYYYGAIFGPFKKYVLLALEKIKDFSIDIVCTGHGPVLDENPREIMDIYKNWSLEENPNDKKTIVIPYVAAYGYTEEISKKIIEGIKQIGDFNIKPYNIDIGNYTSLKGEILNEIYWADGILLGTSTINGDALPLIWDIAISLNPIVHGDKVASAFGSFGWSGEGVPNIVSRLDQLRMKVLEGYKVPFRASEEELDQAIEFGKTFANSILTGVVPPRENKEEELLDELNPSGEIKKWKCVVCGEIYEGVLPPKSCPACGVTQDLFEIVEEEEVLYSNDNEEKFYIIGNGASGVSAAEAIRKRNKSCSITIISKEKNYAYYRPMISDKLYEDINDNEFFLKKESWYKENKIDVVLDVELKKLDENKKIIELSNGEMRKYDKLILANGSRAAVPPIRNININGSFTLRNLEDVDNIVKKANNASKIVIIGGGVLGLETAWAMKQLNLEIDIVEMETRIFPRQLDEDGSKLLEEIIKSKNINIYKNTMVKAIKGDGEVTGVELDNGKVIDADMVVVSAGIKPNKEIFSNTKLELNRGIIINAKMETNIPDIYAAGDVAEYDGVVYGIWAVALKQGEIAGANATGDNILYKQVSHPITFCGMDTDIFSIGDLGKDNTIKYQINEYRDDNEDIYQKMYFKKNQFSGGILIKDISKAGTLINAARKKTDKKEVLKKIYK